jgi:hypothetical protein
MSRVSLDKTWSNYSNRPIKDILKALFDNFEQVFKILNKDVPELTPDVVEKSGLEEEIFMMGEI